MSDYFTTSRSKGLNSNRNFSVEDIQAKFDRHQPNNQIQLFPLYGEIRIHFSNDKLFLRNG